MSSPQGKKKKRKTGGNAGGVQRKRRAEQDLDVPTLGQVAEEARFALLRGLLAPVKDTPVNELSEELRVALKKRGGDELELVLLFLRRLRCQCWSSQARPHGLRGVLTT